MFPFIAYNARGLRNKILRENTEFKKILNELEKSQWYTQSELEELQNEKLRVTIRNAYENVPYYKKVFDARQLKPLDIKTKDDLWKIPYLYKKDVKEHFNELISVKANKRFLYMGHTSGTTGTPAHFYRDMHSINFENAIIWRQWHWAGYYGDSVRATLRGDRIKNGDINKPPFWTYNIPEKQLLLSSFHLSQSNIEYYIEAINKYKARVLQAYPSAAYLLAKFCKEKNVTVKFDAVFTSSEPVYDYQRALIENMFDCKIWDFYGMAERVISASECEEHNGLHVNEEYGIMEFIDKDDISIDCINNNEGIIVGTSLNNYAMPLIRYVTNDYGELSDNQCSCGRQSKLLNPINSRLSDIIYTVDGRGLDPVMLTHIFYGKNINSIRKSQIIQKSYTQLILKVVPSEKLFDEREVDKVIANMKDICGSNMDINVEFVDDIPCEPSGKYRWIISEVNRYEG